jgi:hypothetical protein
MVNQKVMENVNNKFKLRIFFIRIKNTTFALRKQ